MTTDGASAAMRETTAEFAVDIAPADPVLEATGRFDVAKTWTGGLAGTSLGVMLSAGDPASGRAGYVALETFRGTLDGHQGTVTFQQFGTMNAGAQVLHYQVVPGSGTGALTGLTGTLDLAIADGRHEVRVRYSLT